MVPRMGLGYRLLHPGPGLHQSSHNNIRGGFAHQITPVECLSTAPESEGDSWSEEEDLSVEQSSS